MKIQEHRIDIESANMELKSKAGLIKTLVASNTARTARRGSGIPEELQNLMKSSPDHPEVNEIEEDDQVFGVVFQAHNYPPQLEQNDDDEQDS
jgi:hypothetical protein